MDKPKTKKGWDALWQERTLHFLLMDKIREELKERLIQESLGDADYEEYKKSYFDFVVEHHEAVKRLKATPEGGESPLPDT